MFDLSSSEWMLYGGIAVMLMAVVLALLCGVIFTITGKKLNKKLDKEYGKRKQ